MTNLRMPVGKFVGRAIDELPSSYLKWVARNWNEDTYYGKAICEAADKEWMFREQNNDHWEEE